MNALTIVRRILDRTSRPAPVEPPTTDGKLVYAIGDIHGCLQALRQLIGAIGDDFEAAVQGRAPVFVFLGDYVDRGDESKAVIDLIITLRRFGRIELRCLKGNHEEALLEFLEEPLSGPVWIQFGGASTLKSYGVAPPPGLAGPEAWTQTRDAFAAALPPDHLDFFQSLELSTTIGGYMFVHAGVRRGVPLDEQSERDLLWIREPFLKERHSFGKIIVHGHTPTETPFLGVNRIGVDTGAYATGKLTAVRLCDEEQSFISSETPAPGPASSEDFSYTA